MDPDTFRGDVGVEGPDVYWRRRVSVLTGALVVVAVVAWACTSASGGSRTSSKRPDTTGSQHPGASPGALPASGPPPPPAAKAPAAPPQEGRGHSHHLGELCDNADLVLSLRGASDVYSGGRQPKLMLSVVNIGSTDCSADVGPRAVEVSITSGDDRVWSTADCLSGDRADVRRLRRGVPHVRDVGWDRYRSAPDCRSPRQKAREGTYVATARLGALTSSKVVFHLR